MHDKLLKKGLISHFKTMNIMKFKNAEGKLAKTDVKNTKIACEHFTKVNKVD